MLFAGDEQQFWDLVWPDVEDLTVDAVGVVEEVLWIDVHSRKPFATCPDCGSDTARVHGAYRRRLADRPIGGRRVVLRLRVRRFFCDNDRCLRRTVAEQVEHLTSRYRRRTQAVSRLVQAIGLAVGGRAGERLAAHLPVRASRSQILREVRALPDPPTNGVRVLGIDEFAFRKGMTYGTVLIDVETRKPIDLLPDRTTDTVAAWLAEHPGIEVVCRDRCSTFSQATNRALPDAVQVADRRHLLHSLARAVERTAHAHRARLRKDTDLDDAAERPAPSTSAELAALISPPEPGDPPDSQILARVRQWHADVHQLRKCGWTISAIADRLGRDRKTVRRYLNTDLDEILASARERRPNGAHQPVQAVPAGPLPCRRDQRHGLVPRDPRTRLPRQSRHGHQVHRDPARRHAPVEPRHVIPSPRRLTTWIMRHPNALTSAQRDHLDRILNACPDLAAACDLAHEFSGLTRERRGQDPPRWMTRALDAGPPPIQGFAATLQNDWDAAVNGPTLQWSSGAVEGQVTRIKVIKRRSYGRASFELLRTLVLTEPP
ncbi:ISL3 family transposase [Embleya hyalina]|uniref:Transposase n=1 Tax=Embleya hyalina TaxID=516124 RepID=A0A401YJ96_9ACTN|nr:ISL3 family transposase [Embleya hyalina]GCD94685.1 transposase [Embleya hyalina]